MRSRCRPVSSSRDSVAVGEPMDDLQLGLSQLGRAHVHGLLERLVARGEAVAAPALGQIAGGDGRHRAEGEGEERGGHREHVPAVEGELRDDEPRDGGAGCEQRGEERAQAQAGERGQQAEREDGQQVDPARRVAQRQPVGGGVDRVGLDLGARHELPGGRRGRMDVLERRRSRADDDDPPADDRRIDAPVDEVRERDRVDRAGRAPEVDPRAAVVEGGGGRRVADAAGGHHGERLQPAGGGVEALEHAARPGRQVAGAGAGAEAVELLVAAEHVAVAVLVGLGRGEDYVARAPDGLDQGVVLARRGLLGELDVVDDRGGPVAAQAVDRLRVARARERPGLIEVVEGLVVDGHDQQPRRSHRAAALEALVDRVLLEAGQQARELRRTAGADGDESGHDRDHGAPGHGPAVASGHRSAHRAREVTLACAHDDRAAGAQVADSDAAAGDARERPVAAVGDEPGGAAHGDDAVARAGAEMAVAVVAPQRARRAPAGDRGGARAAGRARGQRPAQHELGHAVAARGLADLEATAVEGAGLAVAARQRALQLHAAGAGVDDRAERDRGALGERRWIGRPGHAHEDRAARRREGHAAPDDRRSRGRGRELGPRQRRRGGGRGQRRKRRPGRPPMS